MIKIYSKNPDDVFEKVFSAVKEDFVLKKERFVIRNVATRLHELGFSEGIKKLTSRQELVDGYNQYSSSINLDEYFDEYDSLFDKIINQNDLNTILRYYDNKNILSDFDKFLDFSDEESYEEKILPFLKHNANSLLLNLREKYLKGISN